MLRVVMTGGMNTGKTVFSQVMDLVHRETFQHCIHRYHGDSVFRSLSCWNQFLSMSFAQMTFRESLRDTVDYLEARSDILYHMGLRGPVRRSILATPTSNATGVRVYAALAQHLIGKARRLYANEPLVADLDATVYAFDSTTIDQPLQGAWHTRLAHRFFNAKLRSNNVGSTPQNRSQLTFLGSTFLSYHFWFQPIVLGFQQVASHARTTSFGRPSRSPGRKRRCLAASPRATDQSSAFSRGPRQR